MNEYKKIEKLRRQIEQAKKKDNIEIEIEKTKFANLIKNDIGKKMNNFNSYIKPEPSLFAKIKIKISKIFKYI